MGSPRRCRLDDPCKIFLDHPWGGRILGRPRTESHDPKCRQRRQLQHRREQLLPHLFIRREEWKEKWLKTITRDWVAGVTTMNKS